MFYAKVTKIIPGSQPDLFVEYSVPDVEGRTKKCQALIPGLTSYDFETFRRGKKALYLVLNTKDEAGSEKYYRLYYVQSDDICRSYYTHPKRHSPVWIDSFSTRDLRSKLEENCALERDISLEEDSLRNLYPKLNRQRNLPLSSDAVSSTTDPVVTPTSFTATRKVYSRTSTPSSKAHPGKRYLSEWVTSALPTSKSTTTYQATPDADSKVSMTNISGTHTASIRKTTALARLVKERESWEEKEKERKAKAGHNRFAVLGDM